MLRLLICLVLLFAFPFQAHSALKLIPETAEETASRLSDVVQAVNKVSPSVVSIVSTRTANVNPFQGMAGRIDRSFDFYAHVNAVPSVG